MEEIQAMFDRKTNYTSLYFIIFTHTHSHVVPMTISTILIHGPITFHYNIFTGNPRGFKYIKTSLDYSPPLLNYSTQSDAIISLYIFTGLIPTVGRN